jgi:hypothetical protein
MDIEKLRNEEYSKSIDILSALIEIDADEKGKIYKCFQSMGIKSFFQQLESQDLSPETIDKLKNVKAIIELSGEKRGLR